ncbi:Polyketide synthase, beta-ketoacyl synthase [Frankia sp. Hr75.2]|nr:Polyketide synthase, beta-ketoacyl synthase [Frankia sp. Hr75.2]
MGDTSRHSGGGPRGAGGQEIAIVGMSALFPGAGDLDTYWHNIVGGVDAISDVPPGRWDLDEYYAGPATDGDRQPGGDRRDGGRRPDGAGFYCRRGGFVDDLATFDPARFGIVPVSVDWAEPDQLLALRLAAEAMDDAGGAETLGDRGRVGVVVGRGGYVGPGVARLEQRVRTSHQLATTLREVLPDVPDAAVDQVVDAFLARLGPQRPEASIGLVPNLAASRIANRLDLHGPAYTIDAACASSLVAVDIAVRELAGGRAGAMIVGGVHIVHEVSFWSLFTLLRALSPTQRIRPFDRRADGLLMGEGVGMIVLKRLADARRDGDRVYAVLRGAGTSSDGRTASLMAPASSGQILAIERAWADAGLDPAAPGAVGLIEAHGTATPAGDGTELSTLAKVFGGEVGASPVGLGSVKSMIGHAMPAAGMAGLIKAALALHHRTLPPTLHCDEPHPLFDGSRFAPVRTAAEWEPSGSAPRRAGVNAFGFGGVNAHVVLEECLDDHAGAVNPVSFGGSVGSAATAVAAAGTGAVLGPDPEAERVLLFAGSSAAEIVAQLDVPDADLLGRDDAASPPAGGPFRLALVAPTPRRLALARTVAARGTAWRGRNDLWFVPEPLLGDRPASDAAGGPRLAFLFCGLEDKFAPRIDDVCDHFGLPRPEVGDTAELGSHGVASVQVGRVLDTALRRLGVVPDLVAGHSVGEWNAMLSAGLMSDDYADEFIEVFDPASLEVPGVVFGALGCGAEVAAEVIAGLPEIVVSHDNCPHQSIICGRVESVETALARLRARGVLGQTLPFRSGFHSPFLRPHLKRLQDGLYNTPLHAARVPVWSATTVAPYPSGHDDIRELAVRHLLEPVRFRELTRRLHSAGVRVFVQVGMGSVAGFVDDTLNGPGDEHASLVTNTVKRSGLDQLRRVAVALWAEGAAPRLDVLPCHTRPEPATVPAREPRAPRVPQTAASARPGRAVRLRLGTPLVRLGADAPDLAASLPSRISGEAAGRPVGETPAQVADGLGGPARHAVLAELGAAVTDARAVMSTVTDRWAATRASGPPSTAPAATSVPVAPAAPAASGPAASGPGGGRTVRRELSLATMPEVADHCFYRQPPGWSDPSDLFPVVPLTGVLEMIMAEASALMPGRAVVAVRDVRATRWLAIEPPVQVTITCAPLGPDEVRVDVVGYTRATVVFADAYPAPPPVTDTATGFVPAPGAAGEVVIPGESPSPHTGRAIYDDRLLFHGPGYQGVESVDGMAPTGLRGWLRVTPASGALLDNAGQFFGYWGMQYLPSDWLLFPASVTSMRFFGPPPPVGARMSYLGRIRDVTDRTATADMEIRDAGGRLWGHIQGWTDRRFTEDDVLWSMALAPEANTQSHLTPDGWVVVTEHWRDPASRELSLRHYLDADERTRLARHNPLAARSWLLGRIAAKDAVRRRWWERGAGAVWPIEVGVTDLVSGRLVVGTVPTRPGLPELTRPEVSIAHRPEIAVALAVDDPRDVGGVGIALERIERRGPDAEAAVLAESELSLLDELAGADPDVRAVWLARFAAAKQAAAKAYGTGPAGDQRRFVVGRPRPGGSAVLAAVPRGPGGVVAHLVGAPTEATGLPAPTLVPVTVSAPDGGPGAAPAAAGHATPAEVGAGASETWWVALRTMDTTGRPRPDTEPNDHTAASGTAAPGGHTAGTGDRVAAPGGAPAGGYIVAWTSPRIERSARPPGGAAGSPPTRRPGGQPTSPAGDRPGARTGTQPDQQKEQTQR